MTGHHKRTGGMLRLALAGMLSVLFFFEKGLAGPISADITVISPETRKTDITSFSYFQTAEKLAIEKVAFSKEEFDWKHREGHTLNLGTSFGSVWFRFVLKNKSPLTFERLVHLNSVFLEAVEVFFIRDGKIFASYSTGTYKPRNSRPIDHRQFLFPLVFLPFDEIEVVIMESSLFPRFSMQIWDKIAFQEQDQYNLLFWGGFIGLMAVMALYNLFIFFSLGDLAYLFYVMYVLGSMSHQMCLSGFMYQLIGDFVWSKQLLAFIQGDTIIAAMLFLAFFLKLRREDKWLFFPFWGIFFVTLVSMLVAFANYRIGIAMLISTFAIVIPFAFLAFVLKLREGVREAIYIIVGWIGILTFTMIVVLDRLHLFPFNISNMENFATPIGSAWEMVCFSLALAEKIKMERRQKEEAQHQAIENLKIADRIKRQIFANTSHELRTPLNGMLGFLDLIKRGHYGKIGKGVSDQIAKVQSLALSLKTQVNAILELARSGEKRLTLNSSKILLNEIVEELRILSEGLNLSNKNSEFSVSKSWPSEDDPVIISDREKLFIILRNILANAFKFQDPERKNCVRVNFALNDKGVFNVTVEDTGIGIEEKDREKVFEEFFQVDGGGRRRYEGTGLGLSIVRRYLEIIGGCITLESRVGIGSKFELSVPSIKNLSDNIQQLETDSEKPACEVDPVKNRDTEQVGISVEITDPEDQVDHRIMQKIDGNNAKILVIDDHRYNCEVIRDILKDEGYEVEMALGGSEGIEKLKSYHPNLVLLDMMMPNFSGEDVIRYMKNSDELARIPVIFVTARSSEDDIIVGLKMGADDYLAKPIISEELKLRVGNLLSRLMYARTQSEKSTIIKNIAVAQQVQESYSNINLEIPSIKIAEHYCPAESAGGDWRAVFYNKRTKIMDIFMCDVTGHGIASALYTVAAGSAIQNSVTILNEMAEIIMSPLDRVKRIAGYLNTSIAETSQRLGKMMTVAFISIDLEKGCGAFLNAGHHFCLLGGNSSFRPIVVSGDPIGMGNEPKFESIEFTFSEGDTLFLYTDGLLQNKRENGKNLKYGRLKKILDDNRDPEEIKRGILVALDELWGSGPCEDDYTFMAVKKVA
ncbi:MAG: SpoIIE family protein phosphatase [Oligoflexales bacterium]|nr:SpoIIE family protein phosphatase [Oligoflexales bacterium]